MSNKSTKFLANINLNQAFGFATILAALDGIKATFAVNFSAIDPVPSIFITYFFIFRIKMYCDDCAHRFEDNPATDIVLALISWLAFLVSAAVLGKHVGTTPVNTSVAADWFILALIASTFWVLYSLYINRKNPSQLKKYLIFLVFNFLHVIGLYISFHALGHNALAQISVLFMLIALVFVDVAFLRRVLASGSTTQEP